MTIRALIIAIEHYPKSTETSATLPGTIANAERFAKWIEQNFDIAPENIVFCCSEKVQKSTHGATRKDIKQAILKLIQAGADDTSQLFVFLSGHGVMKPSQNAEPHEDFLLCTEFESSAISGDECINITELATLLSRSLGAGSHLYFLDSCRTVSTTLCPAGLSIQCQNANSGVAGTFLLHSAASGTAAANNSLFTDVVIRCLDGRCELDSDPADSGTFWITFRNVSRSVEQEFSEKHRSVEVRTVAEKSDVRIRTVQKAGPTASIRDASGRKAPPVELLTAYDEVIFLGETNSQLPGMIEKAFAERKQRRWKRLAILSIEDLNQAARPRVALSALEQERQTAEDFFGNNAALFSDELALYRYNYVGTYGSLWTASDGRRRVHVSSKIMGVDIRVSPASDIVDFPADRHPQADMYFQVAENTIKNAATRCVFHHLSDSPSPNNRGIHGH